MPDPDRSERAARRAALQLVARSFVARSIAVPLPAWFALAGAASARPRTQGCTNGVGDTPPNSEGPFFKPRSPQRRSLLEAGLDGERLTLDGQVLDTECRPIAGTLLDFWQADAQGRYDSQGFTLRGHQYSDADGRWRLDTVMPAVYPGRTRHVHVKLQAPGGPVLTTQLYFPGEAGNAHDGLFRADLLLALRPGADGRHGGFDFVLRRAA